MEMFCYQCEQTAKGTGCTVQGVCGKEPEVSALIDLMVYATKGLSMYAHRARALGVKDKEVDLLTVEALFTTVTNVNFDRERYYKLLFKLGSAKEKINAAYEAAALKNGKPVETLSGPATWKPAADLNGLVKQGTEVGIKKRIEKNGADITGLKELLLYGVKGMSAYADHAHILGKDDDGVYAFFHEALNFMTEEHSADEITAMAFRCGETNLKVMGLLDEANTGAYGHPEPTKVRVEPVKGKAIVVSGHDLKDLEELLKQTEGRGINVYTHGEMLPTHAYPALKKYKHLVGNYGSAWQNQQFFIASILFMA